MLILVSISTLILVSFIIYKKNKSNINNKEDIIKTKELDNIILNKEDIIKTKELDNIILNKEDIQDNRTEEVISTKEEESVTKNKTFIYFISLFSLVGLIFFSK